MIMNDLQLRVFREESIVECIEQELRELSPKVSQLESILFDLPKLPSDFTDECVKAAMVSCILTVEKSLNEIRDRQDKLCEDLHAARRRQTDAQEKWDAALIG